jgi:hypothetical protein
MRQEPIERADDRPAIWGQASRARAMMPGLAEME